MTIVCYDGKKMIADSLAATGDMKLPGAFQKIYHPLDDEYWEINKTKVIAFGFSGALPAIPYIRELLSQGVTYRTIIKPDIDVVFEALCVLETGDAYVLSTEPTRAKGPSAHEFVMVPVPVPVAVGSGGVFAYAAMGPKDKNQAEKGVEAAKRLCPFCGGDNVVWELPPPPEVPSKRPVSVLPELVNIEETYPINGLNMGQLKHVVSGIVSDLMKKADEPVTEVKNG
jgi:hypothetical protein